MIEYILLFVLSSCWGIILTEHFLPFEDLKNYFGMGKNRTIVSDNIFVEYILFSIHKLLHCGMCASFHIAWISYYIYFGSFEGILLAPISYFLTFIIKEKILTINL